VAIITIVAMSGLPPFIGFWIKLSVITSLISNQEYLLALLALAVGLFLMFFYLQNYRFSGNLKFNLLQSSYIIEKKFISLNIIVSSLLIVNFIYIFFVNDLLNWNILLNLLY
jgi:formate hydrogenlyase subunit 3/multisubunit Na+/H+ antiporter MnhD subunit